MLIQQTQLQKNLSIVDIQVERTTDSIRQAINNLNASHSALWNLPDEQLTETLQYLVSNGMITDVFQKHYNIATALNSLAEVAGISERAIAKVGRQFDVSNAGVVSLVPIISITESNTPIE